MKRICLIGNYSVGLDVYDGQRLKVRLYYKKLLDEGMNVELVDLSFFKKKPFSTLKKIREGLARCECVVLITADKGAELLIPYINRINKKYNKRFILPLIGTSVLHKTIDSMSSDEKEAFLLKKQYNLAKPRKKMEKELSKIDLILPETELIEDAFKGFFHQKNTRMLTNFREDCFVENCNKNNKIVFISRIARMKGVFDLLKAASALEKKGVNCLIDLFGPFQLSEDEKEVFDNYLQNLQNVKYCGTINPNNIFNVLSEYSFLVFPTRYLTEGTPGILIESLICGVPVISSSFPQATSILLPENDSLLYKIGDDADLAEKIEYLFSNPKYLKKLSNNALKNGEKFTYSFNRDLFLKSITGE